MTQQLQINGIISEQQHGFVPKRSCSSNLLKTLDFVTASLNDGANVDIIYLNFSKAFDKYYGSRIRLRY